LGLRERSPAREKGRKMKAFDYFSPKNLKETSELLIKYGKEAKLMAGGTDLLVRMKDEEVSPRYVIDLKRIHGLNNIEYDGDHVKIGALTTIHEVEISPLIRKDFEILAEAASVLGSFQIRNKGTIGGNLCNASPSADLASPLIALDGRVKIFGKNGDRVEKLENFFVGPGITILNSDEILIEIQISIPPPNTFGTYLKFSPRRAMDLAVVGVAMLITLNPSNSVCTKARIVLAAVAPTPLRAKKAERILEGNQIEKNLINQVANLATEESSPISDIRGSAWYRKEIIEVLVRRSIIQALEKTK
jgi:CO/xanthine dehydrogenase FAD-binding subunit